MINFSFHLNWPLFKNNYDWCKDYFYKSWRVTKHKSLEIQLSKAGDTLVGTAFRWDTHCDHAGVMFELNLLRHFFIINLYDNRHWNDEENRYVNYDNPEEVEKYW